MCRISPKLASSERNSNNYAKSILGPSEQQHSHKASIINTNSSASRFLNLPVVILAKAILRSQVVLDKSKLSSTIPMASAIRSMRTSIPIHTASPVFSSYTRTAASISLITTSLGLGLWEAILRAVPKKKTTHSKTRMRSATKGLKDRTNINNCSACGQPKLSHYICGNCYREIRHRWAKSASKAMGLS